MKFRLGFATVFVLEDPDILRESSCCILGFMLWPFFPIWQQQSSRQVAKEDLEFISSDRMFPWQEAPRGEMGLLLLDLRPVSG